jgi:hypothetical protein
VCAELVLRDGNGQTGGASDEEVEVRLVLQALVPEEVQADRQDVRPPVVEAHTRRGVAHVLVVHGEAHRRRELDPVDAQGVDLLHGVDLLDRLGRARCPVLLAEAAFVTAGEIADDVAAVAHVQAALGAAFALALSRGLAFAEAHVGAAFAFALGRALALTGSLGVLEVEGHVLGSSPVRRGEREQTNHNCNQ